MRSTDHPITLMGENLGEFWGQNLQFPEGRPVSSRFARLEGGLAKTGLASEFYDFGPKKRPKFWPNMWPSLGSGENFRAFEKARKFPGQAAFTLQQKTALFEKG